LLLILSKKESKKYPIQAKGSRSRQSLVEFSPQKRFLVEGCNRRKLYLESVEAVVGKDNDLHNYLYQDVASVGY